MRDWRADLSGTAFGKIIFVYGHIDENGRFVRNWPVRKMAITDKSLENAGLSVKCVLLTDKSSKIGYLSVNLSEILARCQKKKKIRTMHDGADFHHYSVAYGLMSARFHTLS